MPLCWLNREIQFIVHILPVVLLVLPAIGALFYLPLRHVRKSIAQAKRKEMATLCDTISTSFPHCHGSRISLGPTALAELNALLDYKRAIQDVNALPFNFTIMRRLVIYLIIPPLSWSTSFMFHEVMRKLFPV
jgi:hypothetical protein